MISSRTLLLTLIALNLVALAWWSGAMDPLLGSEREPHRLHNEIEAQRLELIGPVSRQPSTSQLPGRRMSAGSVSVADLPDVLDAAGSGSGAQGAISAPDRTVPRHSAATGVVASDQAQRPVLNDVAGSAELPGATPDTAGPREMPGDELQTERRALSDQDRPDGLPLIAAAISGADQLPPEASVAGAGRGNAGLTSRSQTACVRYTQVPFTTVQTLRDELAGQAVKVVERRQDDGPYLVYVEPQGSASQAQRKRQELIARGVTDLHIIQAGPLRNGISVGLLRGETSAQIHRERIAARGVGELQIGPVNAATARYELIVSGPASSLSQQIAASPTLSRLTALDCQ